MERSVPYDGRVYTVRVHHVEGPDPLIVILSATCTTDPNNIGYCGYVRVPIGYRQGWRWAQVGDIESDPDACLEAARANSWSSSTPDSATVAQLEWAREHVQ
ncbi:hypothetical protein FXF51_01565 [Nonomuraea sp. PA05]|uniref:hypothetical protein n=1 Tax=Nonomuraea sp. PA05 TaxID=2604466 RepID=UPI0011D47721|nr:hypothetical protein [Nonomuraea sp. PA05]TYB71149.1 hypothetical protein FXF51_01565 [Nonomuraea sp. PA05]